MKRGFAYVLSVVGSILLLFAMLFACLKISMNDEKWFLDEYTRLGTAKDIGMSNSDVAAALRRLVDYMEGREDSIEIEVTVDGKKVNMYNERETAHMIDVRALYQGVQAAALGALILCAGAVALAAALMRRDAVKAMSRGYLIGLAIFAVLVAAAGVWVMVDFTSFWTAFHHLFFTNDLWLLNPQTDRMILICPEQLFFDIVVRFGGRFLVAALAVCAAAVIYLAVRKKKRATPLAAKHGRENLDGV